MCLLAGACAVLVHIKDTTTCDACRGSSIQKLEEERLENQATFCHFAWMCNIDVDVHVNQCISHPG